MYNKHLPAFPLRILRHAPFPVDIDRTTFILCLTYLVIPNLIFALGYLNSCFALGFTGLLVFGCISILKDFLQEKPFSHLPLREHLWILTWTLILTIISGAGALLPQAWDYYKHNSIWEMLIVRPWPVILFPGKPLVYYIGYYLPAAGAAKIFGLETLNVFAFIWQFSGIYLVLRLARCVFRRFCWYIPVCMLAVFPIDIFYSILKFGILESRCYISNPHLYDLLFHFDAMTRAIRWVPQHFIPAFMVTVFLLNPKMKKYSVFWLAQLIIFSPFAVIGMLFLVGFHGCRLLYIGKISKMLNWVNTICGVIPAIAVMLYLLPAKTGDNLAISGLIFQYATPKLLCLNYFVFLVNVFLIWYLIFLPDLFDRIRKKSFDVFFPLCILINVMFLMLFRMGQFDFPARTLIPSHILMMLWIVKRFIASGKRMRLIMILWFSLGLFCGAYDYCCMIKGMILHPQNKYYMQNEKFFESGLHCEQYIDSDEKLFYRIFSKKGKLF